MPTTIESEIDALRRMTTSELAERYDDPACLRADSASWPYADFMHVDGMQQVGPGAATRERGRSPRRGSQP